VVSVDTYKSIVARAGNGGRGGDVNDVSGFRWDHQMARMIAEIKCGAVLCTCADVPRNGDTAASDRYCSSGENANSEMGGSR